MGCKKLFGALVMFILLSGCSSLNTEHQVSEVAEVVFGGISKTINFNFDSYRLGKIDKNNINKAIKDIDSDLHIYIYGHTCNIGTSVYNLNLSSKRAVAVYDYMISEGVELSQITLTSYGEKKPIASNYTSEGRSKNRRVEIIVK